MSTTSYPKTVARNSKRVAAIFAAATNGSAYSLSNGFSGTEVSNEHIRKQLVDGAAKLVDQGAGRFMVRCHSNLWFEFNAPGA